MVKSDYDRLKQQLADEKLESYRTASISDTNVAQRSADVRKTASGDSVHRERGMFKDASTLNLGTKKLKVEIPKLCYDITSAKADITQLRFDVMKLRSLDG